MGDALKAAFWLRIPIKGLGRMPINVVAVACLSVLGFGNPGFWLTGLGLETLYLATLATHPRFQRWARAEAAFKRAEDTETLWRPLIAQLGPEGRKAVERLADQCRRIEALWRTPDSKTLLLQHNLQALRDLQWLYLKLTIARQHVSGLQWEADAAKLRADLSSIERELADPALSHAARESKAATLAILRKRSEHIGRRKQTVAEIAADVERIEAQVQLVLDSATLDDRPQAISADLDVASALLDAGSFDPQAPEIAELDAVYAQRPPAA